MDPPSTHRYFDTSAATIPCGLGALLAAFSAPSASAADNGAALVREHCASCHGETLGGGVGPPLVGAGFTFRWSGKSAALYDLISTTMPPGQPASLSKPEYRAITQYLLAQSTKEQASIKSAAAGPQVQLPAAPRIVGTASTRGPDDAELARPNDADWLTYNRDYRSQRYSPLRQITPQNVASLVPKCIFQIGEVGPFQASPIVRDGRMYVTTAHRTLALDAATCKPIWTHDYVPAGPELRPLNRGVALYQGMVIRGACDGHLFSLDAATGKLLWDVWVADSRKGYWLAAAPVVFDGKVFIGEAGADTGANGHVHAFDAATGRLLWTFDLIPRGRSQAPIPGERAVLQAADRPGPPSRSIPRPTVYCFRWETPRRIWTTNFGRAIICTPIPSSCSMPTPESSSGTFNRIRTTRTTGTPVPRRRSSTRKAADSWPLAARTPGSTSTIATAMRCSPRRILRSTSTRIFRFRRSPSAFVPASWAGWNGTAPPMTPITGCCSSTRSTGVPR